MSEKHTKIFLMSFSILTALLFYLLLSSNGLILGNDPAVHISKSKEILESGRVSPSEIAWYPPLYRTLLAECIIFTGASNFKDILLLTKLLAVAFNWLLVFSVYLLGAKLVNRSVGILASSLILLCFPLYEANFWGGYPTLLSIAHMCLLSLYLPTKREGFAYKVIVFLAAFSLVLTHHFSTFLAAAVLFFYTLIVLLIFRRFFTVTFILAGLGVLVAFLLWYIPILLPYIDVFISHAFFGTRTYLKLVWRVSFEVFIMNFGFIIVFAFLGTLLTFYMCKRKSELEFYTYLCLSLLIPLLLSQSHFLGVLLPYDRFVYYLMPPAVIFAAAMVYFMMKYVASYVTNVDWKTECRSKMKTITLASLAILLLLSRFPILTSKICEAVNYYSFLNHQSYDAGVWLKNAYPLEVNVVVSEKPGLFFGLASGKPTIMETNPIVERRGDVEVILSMAYEIEHPLTLYRVYEAPMPYELDQYSVLIQGVWNRAAFLFSEETSVSYVRDEEIFSVKISELDRKIFWDTKKGCKTLNIQYSLKNEFALTKSVMAMENKIPFFVYWTFTPLRSGVKILQFNLSIHFDLYRSFEKAYIPGLLNWESPWNKPSFIEGNLEWALVDFNPRSLIENHVAVYDPLNGILCAIKFEDNRPTRGSMGVLSTNQIDALRLTYNFNNVSHGVLYSYSFVAFSEESFSKVDPSMLDKIFTTSITNNFVITYRDYRTCTMEKNIRFLVFDKERFRKEFLNYDFLQPIYSNNQYIICKVKGVGEN